MTRYVAGFLLGFNYNVVLIRKNRPEWQAGLLNGVGGHIEKDETAWQAMVREFEEETSYKTYESDWKKFAVLGESGKWEVTFFWALGVTSLCKSITDEAVEVHDIRTLDSKQCIENIPWLLRMIESQKRDKVDYYQVFYRRSPQ